MGKVLFWIVAVIVWLAGLVGINLFANFGWDSEVAQLIVVIVLSICWGFATAYFGSVIYYKIDERKSSW